MDIRPPRRTRHTHVQSLAAAPSEVFPLLCPVREADWVPGWAPRRVLSTSGFVEEGCVFVTPDEPADAVWIVTHHDPEAHRVEMVKVVPEATVTRLAIEVFADDADPRRSRARVTYEYTSLGPRGDAILDGLDDDWWTGFMETWETALDHYLETGEQVG